MVDKQTAYLEFKDGEGKVIQDSILSFRDEIKQKKSETKDLTQQINFTKNSIDSMNIRLEKKEDERKLQTKNMKNEMAYEVFGEEDVPQEDIIDEEELIMLRELKDLKRDYRDNFGKLKSMKSDLNVLVMNVNTAKENLIVKFETWYREEFDIPVGQVGVNQPIELD